jgi:hypothetical protein
MFVSFRKQFGYLSPPFFLSPGFLCLSKFSTYPQIIDLSPNFAIHLQFLFTLELVIYFRATIKQFHSLQSSFYICL